MIHAGVKLAIQKGLDAAIPDSTLTVSQWAEQFRYVDRGARKGKWSNDTVPYLKEIMDVFTDPRVREVVFQKPSQSGGSEVLMNMIGRTIHLEPTEMAYVGEKEDKAKGWTQESFDATVRSTEVLNRLVARDAEHNNQKLKSFPGGNLFIVWASSPAELSSRPFQYLFFDEKAAYQPTREGDAVKLGEARTKTYSGTEKLVKISSPRDADDEADIEKDYLRGDQREFYVPCPQCNEFQTLKWANLKFEDPDEPYMVCIVNGCMIEHNEQQDMLSKGRWIAGLDFNGIASFKINQLYSPFVPWAQMVKDFTAAKNKLKEGKSGEMKVWVNTALAEPWRPAERIEYADLQLSREQYQAPVPAGVLVLTAAVDVQGDRLECEIKGWGRGFENWSIDHRIIEGSPSLPEVWDALTDHLTTVWDGELRQFRIDAACIDSGGHHTQLVYRFCKANSGRKWFAIKGSSTPQAPLVGKPSLVGTNPKVRLFSIGTNAAKDMIFSYLKATTDAMKVDDTEYGPGSAGYCHFPDDDRYGEEYLKQLCSEKKVPRFRMGKEVHVYEKVSASARNEALDLFVYNLAAVSILNPNFEKIASRRLNHDPVLDEGDTGETDGEAERAKPTAAPKKAKRIRVKNNPFS